MLHQSLDKTLTEQTIICNIFEAIEVKKKKCVYHEVSLVLKMSYILELKTSKYRAQVKKIAKFSFKLTVTNGSKSIQRRHTHAFYRIESNVGSLKQL